MGGVGTQSWLQKLEEQLNVDVDWMDPTFSKNIQITPNDMTSNNLWVNIQMSHPDNKAMFTQTVKELKSEGWLAIYNRIAVNLCKANIDNIKGRVALQVDPHEAYNTQAVLDHARAYAKEFDRAGIPKTRYFIKIPSTGPALNAVPALEAEGIRTLGTALFSLPQAIACSQAGCLYISPYFNEETRAHDDLSLWPNVEDPATQHTMSARIIQILETYKRLYKETGKEQPLLKNASFITPKEAMAAGEMGCHSATISHTVLEELSKLPYDGTKQPGEGVPKPVHAYKNAGPTPERLKKLATIDPLAAANWDGNLASTDIDYLANNGAELEKAIAADPVTVQRLDDALKLFQGGIKESRAKIEEAMKQV
ncbi:aldolase [Zopfia rhizophila CBS 207.26]|uniref:Aldolase n=1 Tax=Zopfia rhizophila CBS 207.26 TaxID=1314779 RepID=A0A6A6DIS0_9PEZI|nr:aldolase [Zopfia rhizophila CBS 207.26]